MMRWYDSLFMGDLARKQRYQIIRGIRRKKLRPGDYVITLATNGNNILDIYPAAVLLLPGYRDSDILILGIAVGYQESLEVARDIVDAIYRGTGELDVKQFLDLTGIG